MAITKQKKEEILQSLSDLFGNSKSVVFSDYKGINVKDFGILRKKLKEKEVVYKVAKRTLIKLAAEKAGFKEIPDEALEGQIGLAFSQGDEIAAAKTLYEFSKSNKNLTLLGALMEGRTLTKNEILTLAEIPGKEELIAKFIGTLNYPISGFHGALSSLIRNLVGVLSSYKDKVEKEKPAEVKEEAKVEASTPEPKVEAKPEPKVEAEHEEPKAETPAEEAKPEEPKAETPAEEAKPEEAAVEADETPAEEPKAEAKPAEEAEVEAPPEEPKEEEPETEEKPGPPPPEEPKTEDKPDSPTSDEPAEEKPKDEPEQ